MMADHRIPIAEDSFNTREAVEQYDREAELHILPEYRYFAHKILRQGFKQGRVLDIGTGSGRLAIELAKVKNSDFDIIGLDISRLMLQKARHNTRQAGLENKIRFVQATASLLSFPDSVFDIVISYASLHHWMDPILVFQEIQRVTKDGGLIIIRDNRRVKDIPLWKTFIWLYTRFTSLYYRRIWAKAVSSSYTLLEVKTLLDQSGINNYRLSTDFIKFDICIEIKKLPGNNR